MDRIDLQVTLLPVGLGALMSDPAEHESTSTVAARVSAARTVAADRWASLGWRTNSEVPGAVLRGPYRLPRSVRGELDLALERGQVTARGYDRIIRIAWSLADLGGRTSPGSDDVASAKELRTGQAA
jgi:magnesium chelatase family protein